jgi:excisionase family DNA binding protein
MPRPARPAVDTTDPALSDRLRPVEWVAEYLGVSPHEVKRFAASGALPAVKLGHSTLRFRVGDVDAFIAKNMKPVVTDEDNA